MGNTETQQKQPADIIDVQLSHPKFANSKLVKANSQVHIQTLIACEQKQFTQWQQSINTQKLSPQHLFLPVLSSFASTKLCGSSGHAILDFPFYPYLLSEEIYNRLGKKTRFQETDLWYLLYSLVTAREEALRLGAKGLGDVRTQNVFLNDEGRVKVGCGLSWPGEQGMWQKAIEKQQVYMSPQAFSRLAKGELQPQTVHQSQDIFSIGLTMLNSAILIEDSATFTHVIDFKSMHYNQQEHDRRIYEWVVARGYSHVLKAIVMNLVEVNYEERMTQEELFKMLEPNGEAIKERRNFAIANAPAKVHHAVAKYSELKAKLHHHHQLYVQESTPNSNSSSNNINSSPAKGLLETSTVVRHEMSSTGIHEQEQQANLQYEEMQGVRKQTSQEGKQAGGNDLSKEEYGEK